MRQDGEASELITWWVPAALAEGTDLAGAEPVNGGIRGHLSRRKGLRVHVLEQVVARHPTAQEAKLLKVGKSAPMLAMYVAAREASGEPVLVTRRSSCPATGTSFEDAYQVG